VEPIVHPVVGLAHRAMVEIGATVIVSQYTLMVLTWDAGLALAICPRQQDPMLCQEDTIPPTVAGNPKTVSAILNWKICLFASASQSAKLAIEPVRLAATIILYEPKVLPPIMK